MTPDPQPTKPFAHRAIIEIPTSSPTVHAFKITGHVDDDTSEALAEHMNAIFDRTDGKVNMLLDMTAYTGSDWDNLFDGDVLASRFRALKKVGRYAVVGAPDGAARMINLMDKIIPVEAKAFDASSIDAAWNFVGDTQKAV